MVLGVMCMRVFYIFGCVCLICACARPRAGKRVGGWTRVAQYVLCPCEGAGTSVERRLRGRKYEGAD